MVGESARAKDWRAWHDDYADPASALSKRLHLVREHIDAWLDETLLLDTRSLDTPSAHPVSLDTRSLDTRSLDTPSADPVSLDTRSLDTLSADPVSPETLALDTRQNERTWPEVHLVSGCAGQGHDVLGVLARREDAARVRATLIESDHANVRLARATAARLRLDRVEVRCADAGELASYEGAVPAELVVLAGIFGNISNDDLRTSIEALPQLCAPGATVIWTRTRRPPDLTTAVRGWFADAGFHEVAFDAPEGTLFSVGVHRLHADARPLGSGRIFEFLTRVR